MTVAVVTCDRPQLAARLIGDLGDAMRAHGHAPRLRVVDDSREPEHRREIGLIANAATAFADVQCVGAGEKDTLRAELAARSGLDLEWALGDPYATGYTLGANLNALLLTTAGQTVLSFDDDVRPVAFTPSPEDGPPTLCVDSPAVERWFVDDEETTGWHRPLDILAAHRRWLGASVPTEPHARVVATWMGVCGHPGFASPATRVLATADDTTRKDAVRLQAVLDRPRALRCPDTVSFNRGAGFTSSTIAFDNREVLPPFFPIGRGIDLLWAVVTAVCRPNARFAHLQWGLAHDQPTPSKPTSVEIPLWIVVADATRRVSTRVEAIDPAERMRAIGRALTHEGERSPGEHAARASTLRAHALAVELRSWQQQLDRHRDASALWRERVHQRIAEIDAAPPRASVPAEVCNVAGPGPSGWGELGQMLRRYGELLRAWPDIVAHASARDSA